MEILESVNLAPYTTLGIGGPARYFATARNEDDVISALDLGRRRDLDVFILGGGSNLLVSDEGFDGLVIQPALSGVTFEGERVTAKAGEDWDRFVETCVSRGVAGVENLSGIPGSVGGTPVQNVGAYGQEVSDTITHVRCIDRQDLSAVTFSSEECGFSYRRSVFNSTRRDLFVVVEVSFALTKDGEPNLNYRDLANHFSDGKPDLRAVREAVLAIRREKSMVIDEHDPNSRSAGSFFKNPVVEADEFRRLTDDFADVPAFKSEDAFKIPAAWLIEKAGFYKGYALGRAGISANHTLALINRGGATAREVLELKARIQAAVHARFQIELVPEPIFLGFDHAG